MRNTNVWEYVKSMVFTVIAMLAIYIILSFVGQRTVVSGNSMYPRLKNDDNILVNKLAYKVGDVERFDVVIFPHYNETMQEEVYYVKRIIGLPGEMVRVDKGLIYINGELLTEYYGCYDDDLPYYNGLAGEEIYVGEDEYFVLGDNRNNSEDSRTFGCIKKDDLTGKAFLKIYPFSDISFVK